MRPRAGKRRALSLETDSAGPDDDFVLELAIAGGCSFIVTYNIRDFSGAEDFGVQVVTP